jgi:hypothetical protein
MQEWCMAHPWMTFFVLMSLVSGPIIRISTGDRKRSDK